ncbi:phosphotransferase [Corynebacterium sp.]|uniref:phosphotransferase family protein n=1 Tax=Corynebacterium sp. TaxID=1720 RepID=UPI002A9137DE|nr:phosphotransferase [Corynebacterium sp.]MDY5785554.1 phosphotransferase [Corynebacterium sp.]
MEHDNPEVITAAEDILTRRYGGTQKLLDATRLTGSGFAEVYRARVATNPFLQHRSVVVKQSPRTGDVLEDSAFLREVVAYQFTTSLSEEVRPGPFLLGYDTKQRLIIISDSGDGDTLETLLAAAGDEDRVQILRTLGSALGRMHVGTAGREADFDALLARMMRSRESQRQVQGLRERLLMHRIRLGLSMVEESGIAIPPEVAQAAEKMHTRLLNGSHRAFTPFDLSPDNIIYAGRTEFLDYEWAGFRDATFDVGFVVGGFPNYVATRQISDDEAQAFLDAWVHEVETIWPAVRHEDTLHDLVSGALLGWALSSVSILNVTDLDELGVAGEALTEDVSAAGADLDTVVSPGESLEILGDVLRPRSEGPFTKDEILVRRDLYETFDALARYCALGRAPSCPVMSEWACSVAQRLK